MQAWSSQRAILRHQDGGERSSRVVFLFLGLIAVVGWLYVIFTSDLFIVRQIQAEGLVSLDVGDISREVYAILDQRGAWRPWSPRHAWFIDRARLTQELQKKLFAESVSVDNSYTGILRLIVKERSNRFILHSHQQYVWVGLDGVVTDEVSTDEKKMAQALLLGQRLMLPTDPPIIHQDLDELVTTGYSITTSDQAKAWIATASEIAKGGFRYREIEPQTPSSTTARVISADGYPVLVDTSEPLEPQIRAYNAFNQSKPKTLKVSEYVDVRVPGRIYVK